VGLTDDAATPKTRWVRGRSRSILAGAVPGGGPPGDGPDAPAGVIPAAPWDDGARASSPVAPGPDAPTPDEPNGRRGTRGRRRRAVPDEPGFPRVTAPGEPGEPGEPAEPGGPGEPEEPDALAAPADPVGLPEGDWRETHRVLPDLTTPPELEPPAPRPPIWSPTTPWRAARRAVWVVVSLAVLLASYAGFGVLIGGAVAGARGTEVHSAAVVGGAIGAWVGAVAAVEWLWRRWRRPSFEVLTDDHGRGRWAGDPDGAAIAWWLPVVIVGGPVLLLAATGAAVWDSVRWGDRRAGRTLRRDLLGFLTIGAALAAGGAVLGDRWSTWRLGAVVGAVLAAVLVPMPWALQAARRHAAAWFPFPYRGLEPGLDARARRVRGDDIADPSEPTRLREATYVLTVAVVVVGCIAVALGWIATGDEPVASASSSREPAPTTTTTAVPTTTTTIPAAADVVDEVHTDAGVFRLRGNIAGFGLWCQIIEAYPVDDVILDPTQVALIDPAGTYYSPVLDVGTPRASRTAVTIPAGGTGEVETCYQIAADFPPGPWALYDLIGGTDVTFALEIPT
jgi:hypothetical protein